MRKTVKYFTAGETITLFDCRKQKYFNGCLYLYSPPSSAKVLKKASSVLIGSSLLLIFMFLFIPIMAAAISSKAPVLTNDEKKEEKNFKSFGALIDSPKLSPKEFNFVPASNEFKIIVPKIGLTSDIALNVDIYNELEYRTKLQTGVAHAKGSYLPDEPGVTFLFGHSTNSLEYILKYNAKFFELNNLVSGDEIDLSFRGKNYKYVVKEKKIIAPTDFESIRQSQYKLVLLTCWPLGTNFQRLIILADQVV